MLRYTRPGMVKWKRNSLVIHSRLEVSRKEMLEVLLLVVLILVFGDLGSMSAKLCQKEICNPVNARNPPVRACYERGSTDHVKLACPRRNRVQGPGGNRLNQVVANNEGQGHGNQGNIVTGTFTLNKYFATTLFDSGADYSFVQLNLHTSVGVETNLRFLI
ncbi:hypothetical protein Tco_0765637 [Tanacetum coccineum]